MYPELASWDLPARPIASFSSLVLQCWGSHMQRHGEGSLYSQSPLNRRRRKKGQIGHYGCDKQSAQRQAVAREPSPLKPDRSSFQTNINCRVGENTHTHRSSRRNGGIALLTGRQK